MSDPWPDDPGGQPPLRAQGAPPQQGAPPPPPPGGPPEDGPPGGGGSVPRGVQLAVLLVLVALLAAGLTYLVMRGEGSEVADSPDSEPETETTTTVEGGPTTTTTTTEPGAAELTEEELQAEVDRLSEFVETQRGLEFREPLDVTVIDGGEFTDLLLEDFEEDQGDLEILERLLAALGLLEPGTDVVEGMRGVLGGGVLGFYDTEEKRLVVRGTELTPLVRATLVHELVHALDDQWFELHRPDYADLEDETSFGFVAVVEGNARRIEETWLAQLSDDEQQELLSEQALMAMDMDLDGIPWILMELVAAPYEAGLDLVLEVLASGGEELVDDALEEPPTTSSQVLHPERFLDGDERAPVEPPPAEGEIFDEGVFGELSLRLVLESAVAPSEAASAAAGWRGDWFVAWEEEDGTDCVRVDTEVADEGRGDQLAALLEEYAAQRPRAEVEQLDDVSVRFTSCTEEDAAAGGSLT